MVQRVEDRESLLQSKVENSQGVTQDIGQRAYCADLQNNKLFLRNFVIYIAERPIWFDFYSGLQWDIFVSYYTIFLCDVRTLGFDLIIDLLKDLLVVQDVPYCPRP